METFVTLLMSLLRLLINVSFLNKRLISLNIITNPLNINRPKLLNRSVDHHEHKEEECYKQ